MGLLNTKPTIFYKQDFITTNKLKVTMILHNVPPEYLSKHMIIPLTQSYLKHKYNFYFTNLNSSLIFEDIDREQFKKVILQMPFRFQRLNDISRIYE